LVRLFTDSAFAFLRYREHRVPMRAGNGWRRFPAAEAGGVKATATIEAIDAASEGEASNEQRKTPRFPCGGTGEVIILGGALRFTGELLDLSATGCRLATDAMFRLERGTRVEVAMLVNGAHFRVAGGIQSNHKTRGVGLEFTNVSARCARLIQELIAELAAKAEREPTHSGQQRA
jgi:hypothetical protein